MRGLEHRGLSRAEGPIVIARRRETAGFGELVAVYGRDGEKRMGRVVDTSDSEIAIQLFTSNAGLSLDETRLELLGRPLELRVGPDLLGRVFDGLGRPSDGYPEIISSDRRDVNGSPINPSARVYPRDFIQTGMSAIDGMNTLIRGQKLPIFSETACLTTASPPRSCDRREYFPETRGPGVPLRTSRSRSSSSAWASSTTSPGSSSTLSSVRECCRAS